MSKKRPPEQWSDNDVEFFSTSDIMDIRDLSRGLSKDEVLAYYGLQYDDLGRKDQFFFDIEYNRGQVLAKKTAVDRLFTSMTDRNGHQASLAFLKRFAEKWPDSEEVASEGGKTIKFMLE